MKDWINGFRRSMETRRNASEQRRGMRISILEGIPANMIANLLGGPLQTAFLLYLGFTAEQIGIVLAIPPFTLLIQIVVAFAMQRWQNRRILVVWLAVIHRILWVGTGLIPLLSPESAWAPLYIIVFLLSFTAGQASAVIWTSLMADLVPPAVRGRYFGIRSTVHWAAVCVTLLAGGQVLEWLPGGKGFTVLFVISAVCIVWNGLGLTRYPNPAFQSSPSGSSLVLLYRPFADRPFLSATLFISLFVMAQNIVVPLFSYTMLDVLKLTYTEVTLITMLQNIVMMVSYYYWGVLNARYPARTLLLWTFPLIAASCLLWGGLAILPVLLVLVVVHILLGAGLGGYNLLVFNFLIGDSPKTERPMYVAVFSAFTGIAGFLGPLGGGWLYKTAADGPLWIKSYGIVTLTGLSLLVLAVVVAPIVFRTPRKKQASIRLGA
jgi:MFS family permease